MLTDTRTLYEAITAAIERLVSVSAVGEAAVVNVPVSYPSGARAAVHISLSGDKCFVSDCAIGMREAEMAGASDFFDHAAKDAATWFGVGYDGVSVFAASAPIDRIEGAIVAVSNASAMAVGRALLRAAEAKERHANTAVYDRVSEIFGRQNVAKRSEIVGREAVWDAHNVVSIGGRRAIFEFVGEHGNAIASKFLMFSDIVKVANAPTLVSVVSSLEKMSKKANMLGDVSSVLELGAGRTQFERYAKLGLG
jgi:hypothetical protein